jgi:hypothetical protein
LCEQRSGVEPVVAELGEVLGSELEVELVPAVDESPAPPAVIHAEVEERGGACEARQSVDERLEARESTANAKQG